MKIKKILNFIKENRNIPYPITDSFNCNKRIAVVGNSEILKDKEYGKIIDDNDFIIRFNRSPTAGFEKFVGTKTNLRVCGQGVFENQSYNVPGLEYLGEQANYIKNLKNSNILVLHNCNDESQYRSNLGKYTSDTNSVFLFNLKYERDIKLKIISHLNFFKRFQIYRQNKQFTSGMIVLSMLILKKLKPSVFGFSLNKKSSFYKSYWQKGGEIKNPVHDLNLENEILNNFIKERKIDYYG